MEAAASIHLELERLAEEAKKLLREREEVKKLKKRVQLSFLRELKSEVKERVTAVYEGLDIEPPPSLSLLSLQEIEVVCWLAFELNLSSGTLSVLVRGSVTDVSEGKKVIETQPIFLGEDCDLSDLLAFIEIVQALREKGIDPIKDLIEKAQKKARRLEEAKATLQRLEALLKVI